MNLQDIINKSLLEILNDIKLGYKASCLDFLVTSDFFFQDTHDSFLCDCGICKEINPEIKEMLRTTAEFNCPCHIHSISKEEHIKRITNYLTLHGGFNEVK